MLSLGSLVLFVLRSELWLYMFRIWPINFYGFIFLSWVDFLLMLKHCLYYWNILKRDSLGKRSSVSFRIRCWVVKLRKRLLILREFWVKYRVCILKVGDLTRWFTEEVHNFWSSIHLVVKMLTWTNINGVVGSQRTSITIMSNSTKSIKVILDAVIGKFLYNHMTMTKLPNKIENKKGSMRVLGFTQNLMLVWLRGLTMHKNEYEKLAMYQWPH